MSQLLTLDDAFLERFSTSYGSVGKALGMLVRPAFVARPGKTLVWGDWSAIEARVLPWLAASEGAEVVLDVFRASDTDKMKPDVYMFTACQLIDEDPLYWWECYKGLHGDELKQKAKDIRQAQGKVPTLSLGFGGALGALQKMAINYGVYLNDERGQWVVDTWRGTNAWAPDFWGKHNERTGQSYGLWGAVNQALASPGDTFTAGRVAYQYDKFYMGGTLFCGLPCGRLLSYPDIRLRTRHFKDKATGEEVEKTALWYRKEYGWSALWHGKCAENVTQATAGSILREVLVAIDPENVPDFDFMPTIGHTHDEIVVEVDDDGETAGEAKRELQYEMERRYTWRETLPLVSEITSNWYYTKATE